MSGPGAAPACKLRLSRRQRLWRLLGSSVDARAWAHLVRLVNHYNHTHVGPLRRLRLGADPSISPTAAFSDPERIEIGDRVRIGARCTLWAGPAHGRIVVGDDVLFGPEVMVTAASCRYDDGQPVTDRPMDEVDVVIGNDVWLGTRVTVLPDAPPRP